MEEIQQDMRQNGSVIGAFDVYKNFPTYTSGSELGGHAIKIFGWSSVGGEDSWLVANSWNGQWGDHGTFKDVVCSCKVAHSLDSGGRGGGGVRHEAP